MKRPALVLMACVLVSAIGTCLWNINLCEEVPEVETVQQTAPVSPASEPPVARVETVQQAVPVSPAKEPAIGFIEKEFGVLLRTGMTDDIRQYFERLLQDFPREKAPGHWIDLVPSTQPEKAVHGPPLDEHVLYHDKQQANDHWEVFCQRNPVTAEFLKKHIGRPQVTTLPGDFAAKHGAEFLTAFTDHWYDTHETYCKANDTVYYEALGQQILYLDYLQARGDRTAKDVAYTLAQTVHFVLEIYGRRHQDAHELSAAFATEVFFPLLNPEEEQYGEASVVGVVSLIIQHEHTLNKQDNFVHLRSKDYIRAEKWGLHHGAQSERFRQMRCIALAQAYSYHSDYVGAFIATYAYSHSTCDDGPMKYFGICLSKLYGKERGLDKLREFGRLWQAAEPHPQKQGWLLGLDKQGPKSGGRSQEPPRVPEEF